MRQMKRFLCVSSLSPHTMISVLHLVVLSSGPNRALITLSRALPCFCLRVEFLSSVLTSAPLPLFIFRTLQKVSPSPGHCASAECQRWRFAMPCLSGNISHTKYGLQAGGDGKEKKLKEKKTCATSERNNRYIWIMRCCYIFV